jgi:uncharacterized membrane protein YhaH (DUF805 family)
MAESTSLINNMETNENLNIPEASFDFIEGVSAVFHKFATFTGRARRSEFWWFCLFCVIVEVLASLLDLAFGIRFGKSHYGPITLIFMLALFLPTWAVTVRRLHDIGKNGYNCLFMLIPIVNILLLMTWFCRDSEKKENKYGVSPKYGNIEE